MDHSGFALPILPGRTEAARTFQRELGSLRKAEYARAKRAWGIVKEFWFLQQTPTSDIFVAYLEGPDIELALDRLATSRDAFDVWFKQQLAYVTGVDLNVPLPGSLSQIVSRGEIV